MGEQSVLAKTKKEKQTKQNGQKGRSGLIIAVVILAAVLAAVATVLIILLVSRGQEQSGEDKPDDNNTAIVEDGKKEKTSDDNPSIIAPSGENGQIGDHVRGKRDSKVAIIEYADMQCPGCAQMAPKMERIYEKYKDEVVFIYRHYPIAGHQNAVSAAIAVEAAGRQGFYWEMLNAVFDNRVDWISLSGTRLTDAYVKIFEKVSKGKKSDAEQFKLDLSDKKLEKKVQSDKEHGRKDKISATPTIIVNGKEVDFDDYGRDIETTIKEAIDGALESSKQERFQELYSEYQSRLDKQGNEYSKKYFKTFAKYMDKVKSFDGDYRQLEKRDYLVGDGKEVSGVDYAAYYIGFLPNGKIFDSSFDNIDSPTKLKSPLNGSTSMIEGWLEGIKGMRYGGVREITMPSSMGYGENETGGIPANSTLRFIVMIIEKPAKLKVSDELEELAVDLYGISLLDNQ